MKHLLRIFILLCLGIPSLHAQVSLGSDPLIFDYSNPKEYTIAAVEFQTRSGSSLDNTILKMLTGLNEGDKIMVPGDAISKAIQALWKQNLFSGIDVSASRVEDGKIWLLLQLTEKPRMSRFRIVGVKKSDADELRESLNLITGKTISENLLVNAKNTVRDFYLEKGYPDVDVQVTTYDDTAKTGGQILRIDVQRNRRIKIKDIEFVGNAKLKSGKLRRKMKNTKENPWWSIFTTSKFQEDNYREDLDKVLAAYYDKGYKDARIVKDTVYRVDQKHLSIRVHIEEGPQYFFRNITWVGNSKFSSKDLSARLGIKKGDIYNQATLEQNLFMNASETDVTSMYMNDGHLFFQVTPAERIEGDSVDIEMRIYEGKQAIINRITVVGNDKTSDHVILREIRTRPGQLFRRSDIIRTTRELAQLGYFDPEKTGVNPVPNPQDGTVDIEYRVEEKPSDQLQLSGGWGAGRLIGNLGLAFNNFSARKFFKKGAWQPLPSGDGQRLSINASSTGRAFQSYNLSFSEPWLGGRKPNSLTVTAFHSSFGNGAAKTDPTRSVTKTTGVVVGLGRRLRKPDDFFSLTHSLSYSYYELANSSAFGAFTDGFANNFSFTTTLSRNSVDEIIYPRSGASISLSMQLTPPYSTISHTAQEDLVTIQQRYKWIEYHKWKFDAQWFTPLTKDRKLVLMTRANFGFIGYYNKYKGISPLERFRVGGTGLTGLTWGAQFLGAEIVGLRGYEDGTISNQDGSNSGDAPIYNRMTMELRYPISLNPSATVFGLAFLEGGNTWSSFRSFDPFSLRRSAGIGVRVYLPMFGLLGLDYGYRFDTLPGFPAMQRGMFHFIIGQNFN